MIENIISTLPRNKESIYKGFCNCRKLKKYIVVPEKEFVSFVEERCFE